MAGEQSPSGGKTLAIGAMSTAQGVTVLLWFVHKFGIDDMPPEVAAAIIGFAGLVAGAIMHHAQRKKENEQENEAAGVVGGPVAQP